MSNAADLRGEVTWKEPQLGTGHEKVARVHQIFGAFYGAMALLFLGVFLVSDSRDDGRMAVLIFVIPALVHGLLAFGAIRRHGWSRVASLIMGVLMLPGIPIGTIAGIYLIRHAKSSWSR